MLPSSLHALGYTLRRSRRHTLTAALLASSAAFFASPVLAQGLLPENPFGEGLDVSGVKLVVGVLTSSNTAFIDFAETSGAFEGTPYEVEWSSFNGAAAASEALHADAIDLNVAFNFSAPVIIQANAGRPWTADDRPFVIIGAEPANPLSATTITVHPESDINTVNDLAGHSITFARGTTGHYLFVLAAKDAGLPVEDVEVIPLTITEALAAFTGRSIDSLATGTSNARKLIASGDGRILITSEGLYQSYAWLLARPEILEDPETEAVVADVLLRLQKVNEWHAANLEGVATDIFARTSGQTLEDARVSVEEALTVFAPITPEVIASYQDQVDVFVEAGVTQSHVDANIAFDTRFNVLYD